MDGIPASDVEDDLPADGGLDDGTGVEAGSEPSSSSVAKEMSGSQSNVHSNGSWRKRKLDEPSSSDAKRSRY